MEFSIPPADSLNRYTVAALRDLALEAAAAYDQLYAQIEPDPSQGTDEQFDYLDSLNDFMVQVDDELDSRRQRSERFASHTKRMTATGGDEDEAEETEPDDEAAEEEAPAAPAVKPKAKTGYSVDTVPSASQIAAATDVLEGEVIEPTRPSADFTLIAAPDTGFAAGAELGGWLDVAKAFVNRTASYRGAKSAQQHTVAMVRREFSDEFSMGELDSDEVLKQKLDHLRDEKRLEGGSLLAGVGWCAPSETIYTTCNQVTISGILSLPEIGARRGGVRHNQGIDFSTIFGAGTGYNILTEAQVISDTAKTCVAIPCPSFVDDRLKVAVLCLTGDILQNRGYPEFVSEFVQGAIATQAHNVNKQVIADIVTGSTAVNINGEPFLSDGSVVSNLMSAVDMAVVDIKYRLRLEVGATVQIVLPLWIQAQLRADWIRRNANPDVDLADSAIAAMFAARSAAVSYVYDWQDAFSGVAGNPGDATPLIALPTSVQFLAFPAGTWVLARQDVIRLDSIYDSTNITTNKVTQLFLEDGFRAMRFCPLSRVYTLAICPSGSTGAQRTVDCVTP
jgi:hypothetical protein